MLVVQHHVGAKKFDYIAQLGDDVDQASISTSYKNEILTIIIPRTKT